MSSLKRLLRAIFDRAENVFDRLFTPAWNPLYQLGALGWYFYWIVAVSGIYVYIFFDTGVTQAYASLEIITHSQWWVGGLMRSLHRYASDALVVVVVLHLVREFAMDRLRGRRWFAWVTGVPLLWFIYASGITGYWLVWDTLAQYVAIATTEWLDSLPLFGESVAANFASNARLSSRFFTLLVFMHIAIPLFLLFFMWLHIQRHTNARMNPHRGLAIGTMISLIALSLAYPAVSQAPANLDTVPTSLGLDWFYLALYPLLDVVPGGQMWLFVTLATVVLLLLPWLPPLRRPEIAVVNLDNCNGCGRCNADCPFSAITMGARTDGLPFEAQAVVDTDNCVSCGLCVGACPTATPYRRSTGLVPGIELPDHSMAELRERIQEVAKDLSGNSRVIVFGCDHGMQIGALAEHSADVVTMPCVGMLPPAFIDFVLSRKLADGVFITGCREGDCHFRLGADWTEDRMAGRRDPYLRKRVPRDRLRICWAGGVHSHSGQRVEELTKFKEHLATLEPLGPPRSRDDTPRPDQTETTDDA